MRGHADKKFYRLKKEANRARWKRRFRLAVGCAIAWIWAAFCVVGTVGLVGRDAPYLVGLLATAVWCIGIYLAIRVWGDWFES